MMQRKWFLLAILLLLLPAALEAPVEAAAQTTLRSDATREQVTRAELIELRDRLEANDLGEAITGLAIIQRRLAEGDFQVGDRIVLDVRGEPEMSDTLMVAPGREVDIPGAGRLSLEGILRSELQDAMGEHIAQYVRDPQVRTEALIRVSILGAVGSPGFYLVPAHVPITDVLMTAGGPAGDAVLPEIHIERGEDRIWEGQAMETAIIRGRTLDQLNVQAGDRIVVPREEVGRDGWRRARDVLSVVGGAISLIFVIERVF